MGTRLLQTCSLEEIAARAQPRLVTAYGCWHLSRGTVHTPRAWYELLVSSVAAEVQGLDDLVVQSRFAFGEHVASFGPDALQALSGLKATEVLHCYRDSLLEAVSVTPEQGAEQLRTLRHLFRDRHGLRGLYVMTPIRAALTGSLVGPCLGIVVSLLGRDRCRLRIEDQL